MELHSDRERYHVLVAQLWHPEKNITVGILLGEGNGTPLQYSCLENPMDGGAWWAAVHGVAKGQTWLNDFTFTIHFHALEKEMATHSSVLAWRIPGTGEPGGAIYGVAQSRTQLKQFSSSSSRDITIDSQIHFPLIPTLDLSYDKHWSVLNYIILSF